MAKNIHMRFQKRFQKQKGIIVLLWLLALVLGSAIWFGSIGGFRSEAMQMSIQQSHVAQLKQIKEKLLTYAIFQPEIFRTDTSGNMNDDDEIPGPGYFPCPDIDNDGVSDAPCGTGVSYVLGRVPIQISSRQFNFISDPNIANRFWYAVDSRFVVENLDYNNFGGEPFKRYAPLNINDPASPLASLSVDDAANNNIVLVLFYAGEPINGQVRSSASVDEYLELENSDADGDFISTFTDATQFNDVVLTITREEWNAAMLSRVSSDVDEDFVPDLCTTAPAAGSAHWFNDCVNIYGNDGHCPYDAFATDNQVGQGWRTELGCP